MFIYQVRPLPANSVSYCQMNLEWQEECVGRQDMLFGIRLSASLVEYGTLVR